jgi:hypothetical protein
MSKKLIFEKSNYVILILALSVITLGFVIMGLDNSEYGFGTSGLTVAPIVVLLGFGLGFFAIFYKRKISSTK